MDRKLFRIQAKKEYKKFVKQNPTYKNITFSQYVSLLKLTHQKLSGLGQQAAISDADSAPIDDMFTEASVETVEEQVNETATP